MPRIPGLRSPHAKVGRVVYFGRMLDKIRLHADGRLPAPYGENLGDPRPHLFDARCCRFLGLAYADVKARALEGGCDEEILAWAHGRGAPRTDEECLIWNRFFTKIGWRDNRSDVLRQRTVEYGFAPGSAETFCELLDLDEGRPPGGTRSWESPPVSVLVIMGVSGCGKTTVGKTLAQALGWEFQDADGLHSAANVTKMAAGAPLTDADRAPWLDAVRAAFEARVAQGARVVVACSALREAYRASLTPDPGGRRYVLLKAPFALIAARLRSRAGHFMGETLLRSQFDTLEEPRDALAVDASQPPGVIADRIRSVLGLA